jgi:Cu/Ag efflux pump CusA
MLQTLKLLQRTSPLLPKVLQAYNISTAVWVGLIAVIGTASETGILMVAFLDQAVSLRQQATLSGSKRRG